ncbi:MAG: MCE family protein [Bacteroidales bacterium]|nr:MCE family protein [Bacteroidales bacterium]
MKISSSQKIGLFLILILVALFFALNYLKGHDIFKGSNTYYTYLGEVDGITVTSPVYIKGLKVGAIDRIKFDPVKDCFLISLSVKKDYSIPSNSRAEAYSSSILGGKSLRIVLGDGKLFLRRGDTIPGSTAPDMISILYGYASPLKNKLGEVMEELEKTLSAINQTLDSAARADLHSSLHRLNGSLANVQKLTGSLNEMTPDLSASLKNINALTDSLSSPNGDFHKTLSNLNKTSQELSTVKLSKTVDELNALLEKVQSPESTTGKLISTDALHNSLDSLVVEIEDLVKKIKENPKKYIRVKVF